MPASLVCVDTQISARFAFRPVEVQLHLRRSSSSDQNTTTYLNLNSFPLWRRPKRATRADGIKCKLCSRRKYFCPSRRSGAAAFADRQEFKELCCRRRPCRLCRKRRYVFALSSKRVAVVVVVVRWPETFAEQFQLH